MDFRIFSSLLVNNTASFLGGAMYCDTCRLVAVYDSIVKDNSAGHDGGGIYCDTCVQVALIQTLLLSNRWALENVVLYHGGLANRRHKSAEFLHVRGLHDFVHAVRGPLQVKASAAAAACT